MLTSKPINKLIFIDIESVPQHKSFFDMSENMQGLFLQRFKKEAEALLGVDMDDWDLEMLKMEPWPNKIEKFYNNRAPVCGEFLKIVCVSVGWIEGNIPEDLTKLNTEEVLIFKSKSFYGHDEREILSKFHEGTKSVLDKKINPSHHLVGYNIFGFDLPVLAKHFMMQGLPLPAMLDTDGLKMWNLPYIVDVKESWKGTDFGGSTSLALLCECMGVPSPKSETSGKMVRDIYYEENDVERIARYCQSDIYRLCEAYLKMKGIKNNLVLFE